MQFTQLQPARKMLYHQRCRDSTSHHHRPIPFSMKLWRSIWPHCGNVTTRLCRWRPQDQQVVRAASAKLLQCHHICRRASLRSLYRQVSQVVSQVPVQYFHSCCRHAAVPRHCRSASPRSTPSYLIVHSLICRETSYWRRTTGIPWPLQSSRQRLIPADGQPLNPRQPPTASSGYHPMSKWLVTELQCLPFWWEAIVSQMMCSFPVRRRAVRRCWGTLDRLSWLIKVRRLLMQARCCSVSQQQTAQL